MKKMAVIMLILGMAVGCVGCNSSETSSDRTPSYETDYFPDKDQGVSVIDPIIETPMQEEVWSDTHETAPMPEEEMTADDIVGTWVHEPEDLQPSIIEIWQEGSQLRYRYYSIIPGNGNGFALAKEYTEFEYNSGKVNMNGIAAQFNCMAGDSDYNIYTSYYYDEENDQIADQEDGKIFYHINDYIYDNNKF